MLFADENLCSLSTATENSIHRHKLIFVGRPILIQTTAQVKHEVQKSGNVKIKTTEKLF